MAQAPGAEEGEPRAAGLALLIETSRSISPASQRGPSPPGLIDDESEGARRGRAGRAATPVGCRSPRTMEAALALGGVGGTPAPPGPSPLADVANHLDLLAAAISA